MPLVGDYEPSPSEWSREHADRYEESGGTDGAVRDEMAFILVTSVGAKSGKLRRTPLMRVEHNGEYALVASHGGDPRNPTWYYNLVKNPHVELRDGTVKLDYLARQATGEERAAWWARSVAAFPTYAEYQAQTTRVLPVFILTPMPGGDAV